MLTGQHTTHSQKATRAETLSFLFGGYVGIKLYVEHLKECRVIEQPTVNTTTVGTFHVAEFEATGLEHRLVTQVAEHSVVLHLAHANHRAANALEHVGTHVAQRLRHVMELT